MAPRFFAPALQQASARILLPREESAHAARVLRVAVGDKVRVFDGRGCERAGVVAGVSRAGVEVTLGEEVPPARELPLRVTLAQALLKGDKVDAIVRDAVMLGVSVFQPVASDRSDVPAAVVRDRGRPDRWRRVAVASAKQCGRAVVPEVLPIADLASCLARDESAVRLILAEPSLGAGSAPPPALLAAQLAAAPSLLLLAGPEGGWSNDEAALAVRAGCLPLTLGARTLRADAAALVAMSILMYLVEQAG